ARLALTSACPGDWRGRDAVRRRFERPGPVEKRPAPQLERQERVEPEAVVGCPRGVLCAEPRDDGGVDEAAAAEGLLREELLDERGEVAHEPRAERGSEAGLPPPDDLSREDALLAPLEDVLAAPPVQLEARRDLRCELDK